MKKKSFTLVISIVWVLLSLLAVAGFTYAWFTFNPSTNVEPISSTISDGEVALLISTDAQSEFKTSCALPQNVTGALDPISTRDLENFYRENQQNRQGIAVSFVSCQDKVNDNTIHGTLYLKSLKDGCSVYFNRSGLEFGSDSQMLSALRLGMKFHTESGDSIYIFSLDEMTNMDQVQSRQTTAQTGVVIGSINADGSPNYVADPAERLSDYFAVTGAAKLPTAGRKKLCVINANEIATVEYWLYLEGCDENCFNSVQQKDVVLQLSFAGVTSD